MEDVLTLWGDAQAQGGFRDSHRKPAHTPLTDTQAQHKLSQRRSEIFVLTYKVLRKRAQGGKGTRMTNTVVTRNEAGESTSLVSGGFGTMGWTGGQCTLTLGRHRLLRPGARGTPASVAFPPRERGGLCAISYLCT